MFFIFYLESVQANSSIEFLIIILSTTESNNIIITIDSLKNPKEERYESQHILINTDGKEETGKLSSNENFMQDNLPISEENECNFNKQIFPYTEKIRKLEKLLQKSESLRIIMKKDHKQVCKRNTKAKLRS